MKTFILLLALFLLSGQILPALAETIKITYTIGSKYHIADTSKMIKSEKSQFTTKPSSSVKLSQIASGQPKNRFISLPADKETIAQKILDVFGENGKIALAVARAESGLRCEAVNWGDAKITGMPSQGIFQLNRPHNEIYFDCDYNIQEAYKLFLRRGFSPWSTYLSGAYYKFL